MAALTTIASFAQREEPESVSPTTDVKITRGCYLVNIEGRNYGDVTIELKSISPDFIAYNYRVKVKVMDEDGKAVYKKTFKNCYLYIFSDGGIQVGKPRFSHIVISKDDCGWFGVINGEDGIWSK